MTTRITAKSLVGEEQMGIRRVITDIRVLQRERLCAFVGIIQYLGNPG